jgi:hypothetical protein
MWSFGYYDQIDPDLQCPKYLKYHNLYKKILFLLLLFGYCDQLWSNQK